jgi:hypothetical protein
MQKRLVAQSVPQPAVAGGGGRAACVFGLAGLATEPRCAGGQVLWTKVVG